MTPCIPSLPVEAELVACVSATAVGTRSGGLDLDGDAVDQQIGRAVELHVKPHRLEHVGDVYLSYCA